MNKSALILWLRGTRGTWRNHVVSSYSKLMKI